MPRSIGSILDVPLRKIIQHVNTAQFERIELLNCGHSKRCPERSGDVCCASRRRCYQCKNEGYRTKRTWGKVGK
jgi:hypothetical protein